MSELVTLKPRAILDPRGQRIVPSGVLAPRLGSLKGKRILLLDNGQPIAGFAHYGQVLDRLEERLKQDFGVGECIRLKRRLLSEGQGTMKNVASELARTGAQGVVIALAHGGITMPSTICASELEKRHLPTVLICTPVAINIAAVIARSYLPGLPLCVMTSSKADSPDKIREETDKVLGEIVAGLTLSPVELKRRFEAKQYPAIREPDILESGEFPLRLKRKEEIKTNNRGQRAGLIDPSGFAEEVFAEFCDNSMGDGFPIIAPTRERVARMLDFSDREGDEVIANEFPPSGAAITVGKVAVNAVMAGCKPEYFPIVLTAIEAMVDARYRLSQGAVTTHSAGNAVVVSGPLAGELSISSGPGCLGPGFRANATIGRSVNLVIMNVCRAVPGISDMTDFGSPAKYSYCFAENDAGNPWLPIHTELFDAGTTTVTVFKCEGPSSVADMLGPTPEDLLRSIASVAATLGGNNAYRPGELLLILNPDNAQKLANLGWSKADVKSFLFEQARNPADVLAPLSHLYAWPKWFAACPRVPVMERPEDLTLVVAGGKGPHAMVGIPWPNSRSVTRPVVFKNGRPVKSVRDFAGRK